MLRDGTPQINAIIHAAHKKKYSLIKVYMDLTDPNTNQAHLLIEVAKANDDVTLLALVLKYHINYPADYEHPVKYFITNKTRIVLQNQVRHWLGMSNVYVYAWDAINCCLRAKEKPSLELINTTLGIALLHRGTMPTIQIILKMGIDVTKALMSFVNTGFWPVSHSYVELLVANGAIIDSAVIDYREHDKNFQNLIVKNNTRLAAEKTNVQLSICAFLTLNLYELPHEIMCKIVEYAFADKKQYYSREDLYHFNERRQTYVYLIATNELIKQCTPLRYRIFNKMSTNEEIIVNKLRKLYSQRGLTTDKFNSIQHLLTAFVKQNPNCHLSKIIDNKYQFLIANETRLKLSK